MPSRNTSSDTSIRVPRTRSDRSGKYEAGGVLVKKPGRRASTLPDFMWSIRSPVLTEFPRLSEMPPQSSFSTATEYPGCRSSPATSVVFPAPEPPVITTPACRLPHRGTIRIRAGTLCRPRSRPSKCPGRTPRPAGMSQIRRPPSSSGPATTIAPRPSFRRARSRSGLDSAYSVASGSASVPA